MGLSLGEVSLTDPADGWDRTAGKVLDKYFPEAPNYEVQNVAAPGEDGVAVKDNGFRGRLIYVEAFYVEEDEDSLYDEWYADLDSVYGAFLVTVGPFDNCRGVGGSIIQQPKETGYGTVFMKVRFIMEQKRLSA